MNNNYKDNNSITIKEKINCKNEIYYNILYKNDKLF